MDSLYQLHIKENLKIFRIIKIKKLGNKNLLIIDNIEKYFVYSNNFGVNSKKTTSCTVYSNWGYPYGT